MFSGIVESQSTILDAQAAAGIVRLTLEKPSEFNDLKAGDSIAVNGVCLTLERFDDLSMVFALGAETLHVTGWSARDLKGMRVNVERSLRFGDRVHGHLVTGHVDAVATIAAVVDLGGSNQVDVRIPPALRSFVWQKGSWAVNGVSLTINAVADDIVSVCLIPETLARTNLGQVRVGDRVNIEFDWLARGLFRALELGALEGRT